MNSKITWTRKLVNGSYQYFAGNGARVYALCSKPFAREWGVQLPSWTSGDGGFRSLVEAKAYVERHSNPDPKAYA